VEGEAARAHSRSISTRRAISKPEQTAYLRRMTYENQGHNKDEGTAEEERKSGNPHKGSEEAGDSTPGAWER
jgi:hypothetical protein